MAPSAVCALMIQDASAAVTEAVVSAVAGAASAPLTSIATIANAKAGRPLTLTRCVSANHGVRLSSEGRYQPLRVFPGGNLGRSGIQRGDKSLSWVTQIFNFVERLPADRPR